MARIRHCSYCGESKHNRRTCTTLKRDTTTVIQAVNKYRAALYNKFEEVGLGPGALVTQVNSWDEKEERLYMVKSLCFKSVSPVARGRMGNVTVMKVKDMAREDYVGFGELPEEWNKLLNRNTESHEAAKVAESNYKDPSSLLKIVSPVGRVGVPASNLLLKRPSRYHTDRLFNQFNIVPASYREEDKYRQRGQMERLEEYLERNDAEQVPYVRIW